MRLAVRHRPRGAVALLFVPLLAFILMMIIVVTSASQVSLQKTMTSNAADAAALGGASYIASGIREAAWISRKSYSALALLQAIYLIPFCPGEPSKQYAKDLWKSFAVGKEDGDVGPLEYYAGVAAGALVGSHKLGRRAVCVGFVRNLRGMPSGVNCSTYYNSALVPVTVAWSAGDFQNTALLTPTYPSAAMGLTLAGVAPQFLQWDLEENQATNHFHCGCNALNVCGASAVGIDKEEGRWQPFAAMIKPELSDNALASSDNMTDDLKSYETIDLEGGMGPDRIPQIAPETNAVVVGACTLGRGCGITRKDNDTYTVFPSQITGDPFVSAGVEHHATGGGGLGLQLTSVTSKGTAIINGVPLLLGPTGPLAKWTNEWKGEGTVTVELSGAN